MKQFIAIVAMVTTDYKPLREVSGTLNKNKNKTLLEFLW